MKGNMRWRSFWDAYNVFFSDLGSVYGYVHFVVLRKARHLEFTYVYASFALIKQFMK